jgi:WD40 repeat protein
VARVVANVHRRFRSAFFYDKDSVVASTFFPELSVYSPSSGLTALGPHVFDATSLTVSRDRKIFLAYGAGKDIEVWSTMTMSRVRLLDSKQGAVSQAEFVAGADQFLTSGSDGRILRWNSSGDSELVARMNQPVAGFVQISPTNSLVVRTADGALWHVTDTSTVELRPASSQLTHLVWVPGSRVIVFAYLNGDIHAMNIESRVERVIARTKTAIRHLVMSGDGKTLIVSRADGVLQIAARHDTAWSDEEPAWLTVNARARHITLASNNWLIAACTDGTVWFYSLSDRTWRYLPIGTADVVRVAANNDGTIAAAFDTDGRIISIDLERLRQEAEARQQ